MTAPAEAAVSVRRPLVSASWRVRLIATLPALPLLAAQPIIAGLTQIATSPVSEDVPQTALDLITIGVRTFAAAVVLIAVLSLLLARVEAEHDRTRDVPTRVPWILGVVPVLTLGARAIALRRQKRRGSGPFAFCIMLIAGSGLIFLLELIVVAILALQHSVPLS